LATSKTYLVAWDELLYNSIEVDRQLTEANLDFLVFDVTSEPVAKPNWKVAEKVRYYGHFYNALLDFKETDHLMFVFNAGDAFTTQHAEMTNKFTEMMAEDSSIWVLGPDLMWRKDDPKVSLLRMSNKYENVGLAVHIDGTIVMLRRELALHILKFYDWMLSKNIMNFETMHSGHALDVVYCTLAMLSGKKIYKDLNFLVTTRIGSSYTTNGLKEGMKVVDAFADYMFLKGVDPRDVRFLYSIFQKSLLSEPLTEMPLELIYKNLESLDV
jgi:hypothetical protein